MRRADASLAAWMGILRNALPGLLPQRACGPQCATGRAAAKVSRPTGIPDENVMLRA
jgi:hypothetical protein